MIVKRREFVSLAAAAAAPRVSAGFDPFFATAGAAAEAIRRRKASSVELTEICFRRIDQYNPKLHAIVNLVREEALAQAKRSDAAVAKKQPLGPLHGVPITIKESFSVAGIPPTAGV